MTPDSIPPAVAERAAFALELVERLEQLEEAIHRARVNHHERNRTGVHLRLSQAAIRTRSLLAAVRRAIEEGEG